jgi:vacuolar-type H+-ATPase subunit H
VGTRPDEIKDEIEQTRGELASDVDRLADRTVPSRVAERKWEGVKDTARSVADTVMGARDSATEAASSATDNVQEKAQSVAGTVKDTPDLVARQARRNPLAVGLIAFGAGLLVASLLPETDAEKRAGAAVAERSEGLVEQAKETSRQMVGELSDAARDAAEQVKQTGREAASDTAEQARESGRTTVGQTRQSVSS